METSCEQEHPPNSSTAIDSDQTRNWCDLPEEALHLIGVHLGLHAHLTLLRRVCPEWRSSLPISDFCAAMSIRFPPLKPNLPSLLLIITRFYLLSPLGGGGDGTGSRWLARLGRLGINTWRLFSPLGFDRYFSPSPPLSGSVNVLDCQVSELACVFTLMHEPDPWVISKKIVGGRLIFDDGSSHFVVLAMLEDDDDLFLFHLEDPNLSQWVPIQEANTLSILDIACHNGKFYAFDLSSWRIGLIDPANPLSPMEFICAPDILGNTPMDGMLTVTINDTLCFFKAAWLMSDEKGLYLIIEVKRQFDPPEKAALVVFVLKDNSWERVYSIGDRIFFIGYDVSFSVQSSSINLPQWKPSSICLFAAPWPLKINGYTDEGFELLESIIYPDYWRYVRVFKLEVDEKEEEEKRGVMVSYEKLSRRYTGLFFPPPAWVKWRCPSLGNDEFQLDGLKFRDENNQYFSD